MYFIVDPSCEAGCMKEVMDEQLLETYTLNQW